ncbi:MAG: hypothetical protein PVI43_00595 [Candidatus Bathyarchaeota archaeon]|jgi:hypothetical protein
MTQAVDLLSDIVREELPQMLIDIEPTVAPMFSEIKRTSMGVKSQEGLGKGYQVIHIYNTGSSGALESGDPLGPGMTSISGNQAQLLALGDAATNQAIFPKAQEVPHTGEVKRTLTLHKVNGNYSIPVAWKQLETLNAAQLGKVFRDLKAVAKQKAIYEASSFFSHSVTNSAGYPSQVLGSISAIAEHSSWTDYIVITLDEQYGRIANFIKGQKVDIVADSSGTLQSGTATDGTDVRNYATSTANYIMLIVVDVDYLGKKITLRPVDTGTGGLPDFTAGYRTGGETPGAAGDWICAANSTIYTSGARPQYSWGLNDWVKSSGQILGGADGASGLDLDLYSMFKSQVVSVNASLTDDIINAYIGGYLDAYPGETLDTIITTQGVQQQWLKQSSLYNNRQNYDRTGKSLKFKGGWTSVEYEFGGRKFNWVISPMCLSKTLYGLKFKGNNLKRYAPPKIGGTSEMMGPDLNFLAPLAGHNGVFMGVSDSNGRPLDLLQAPFWYYDLICPEDPRGLKFTGLTEATMTV